MTAVEAPPRVSLLAKARGRVKLSHVITAAVVILIGWLTLGPLALLIWSTIWDGEQLTLEAFRRAYTAGGLSRMTVDTMVYAAGTTVLAVGCGTVLAYLTARTNMPFKGLAIAASLVPLVTPQVLYTIAWIYVGSPRVGVVNSWLEPWFGEGTFDIFSMWGMILIEGLHLTPLVFLLMYAAYKNMDPSLEESALMSGASRLTTVRKVTTPLAAPALYASLLVIFVRGIESFEVPALIGLPDGIIVFMSRIWRALSVFPQDEATAGAYSLGILVLTGVGIYWYSRLTSRRGSSFQTVTGKGFRPHSMDLGVWRWPAAIGVVVYFIVAVVLPFFVLVYGSVQPYYTVPSWDTITSPVFNHYTDALSRDSTLRAFRNSIVLAVATATTVMLVMAVASWMVVRTKVRGRWMIDLLAFLPFAVPGLVMGLAIMVIYVRVPLPIYATLWIIFIAYFTRFMPYGMRYVSTSMHQISVELEESAQTSGATWMQTFRRVLLPLIMPGMIAGWIYIVSVSLRELSSSLLLYSPGNEVLSIELWMLWENGNFPAVAALGVMMTVLLMVMIFVARRIGGRFGVNEL